MALYELDDYNINDIHTYTSCYGGSSVPINRIAVNGGTRAPAGSGAIEVELDMELALSAAPHLASLNVYEAKNDDVNALAEWSQIVNDAVPVVSTSWGQCEALTTQSYVKQENTLFMVAAAQGQSIFAVSGDNGSNDCSNPTPTTPAVDDPASQPFVTGVGGTSLNINGGSYSSESAWNNGNGYAGGGGVSTFWTMPSWQKGPGVIDATFSSTSACAANTGNTGLFCREVPDVSLNADPNKGYPVFCTTGGNLSQGLNNFGPNDRKSASIFEIEGSPFSHAAPDLPSCSRHVEIGKGARTEDGWKWPTSVSEVCEDWCAPPSWTGRTACQKRVGDQDRHFQRSSEFPLSHRGKADVERHVKVGGRPNSKIPSIFDHIVRNPSTIESYYQQVPSVLPPHMAGRVLAALQRRHRCGRQ